MRTRSDPKLTEILLRMQIDSSNHTHSQSKLSHPLVKFSRNTSESKEKRKSMKSSNKIGVLNTIRQPKGSNAYFNILKQKINSLTHVNRNVKVGLGCSECTCGAVCSCGRKIFIRQKTTGTLMYDLFDKIEHVRSTHRDTKKRCFTDFEPVKKKLDLCKRELTNS